MPTKLIRGLYNISPADRGAVATIGHFDGVHAGHQQLLIALRAKAKEMKAPSLVITFEPHAFEFFGEANAQKPNQGIPRITRLREKYKSLSKEGIDKILILPFNQTLASLSASDFVTDILIDVLGIKYLIIGDDFRFGYKRQGDINLLREMGEQDSFTVETQPTIQIGDQRVSSTRVRQALSEGNLSLAEKLLGHPYSMLGRIRFGDQLGRKLGFPTANIYLHRKVTPVWGIYTVLVKGLADHPLPGVASVGTRPTVGGTRTLLEVHLLDFNQQIYGRYVEVEFCKKLRDEEKYPNLDLLREQIAKDVENARAYFKEQGLL